MAMDYDPDRSQAYAAGHFGTRDQAEKAVAQIEEDCAAEGVALAHITIEPDREGGWNVWIWE